MGKQSNPKKGEGKQSIHRGLRKLISRGLFLLLLAFIVSLVAIQYKDRRDYESKDAVMVLNSMENTINSAMEGYYEISRLIMADDDVRKFLNALSVDAGLIIDTRYSVLRTMSVCTRLDSVHIFRLDKRYMQTSKAEYEFVPERMEEKEWQNAVIGKRGGALVMLNGYDALFRKDGQPILTICRAIFDMQSQELIGTLMMSISNKLLENAAEAQAEKNVCIMTDKGEFLAGNEDLTQYFGDQFLTDTIVNDTIIRKYRVGTVSGYKLDELPLVLICYTSSEINDISKESLFGILVLVIAFGIALLTTGSYITSHVTKPLLSLTENIETTQESGWLTKLNVNLPPNEIGDLGNSYNTMVEHMNDMFNSLLEKEKIIQKAELRVLQEQIKPHFLYNSLETISSLAVDAGADEVYSALETLGTFYRNFLSKGERIITLDREICIVQNYLILQKLRYGEVIRDEYDISEEAKACVLPKLILQPLVENSIYHGVRLKGEPGLISIRAYVENQELHLLIRDTGVGMSEEEIEKVLNRKRTESNEEVPKLGFGLWGTIERIRYFCNREDVVRIRSEIGEYTEIEIIIPYSTEIVEEGEFE